MAAYVRINDPVTGEPVVEMDGGTWGWDVEECGYNGTVIRITFAPSASVRCASDDSWLPNVGEFYD